MNGRPYVFRRQLTNATADRALLQLQAPTDTSLYIVRAWVNQNASTTSAAVGIRIVRKSSAATVTAAVIATDIRPLDPDDTASTVQVGTSSTGYNASNAGTNTDTLIQEGFNLVGNGWLYLPVPEERIVVKAGGIIALEAVTAMTATLEAGIVFREL
jgi:hypothetical protein